MIGKDFKMTFLLAHMNYQRSFLFEFCSLRKSVILKQPWAIVYGVYYIHSLQVLKRNTRVCSVNNQHSLCEIIFSWSDCMLLT